MGGKKKKGKGKKGGEERGEITGGMLQVVSPSPLLLIPVKGEKKRGKKGAKEKRKISKKRPTITEEKKKESRHVGSRSPGSFLLLFRGGGIRSQEGRKEKGKKKEKRREKRQARRTTLEDQPHG